MSDEARALRQAREVWRSTLPSDHEIRLGADRIARRFTAPARTRAIHKAWAVGASAAFLGSLAFAGRGAWHAPAPSPRPTGPASDGHDVGLCVPAPAKDPPDVRPHDQQLPAMEPPEQREDSAVASTPPDATRRGQEIGQRILSPHALGNPTWNDVNEALAAGDQPRAERLLFELANRGHDANTRAKAHLGLAQLDEARQDCEGARKHALRAAATPDADVKTLRRALELTARCSR